MKKTNANLILLSMLFATSLVIANVVAGKVIDTTIPFLGSTIVIPGAVLAYAFTFLITDVVNEIWGLKEGRIIVVFGFIAQLFSSFLIFTTGLFPALSADVQQSYQTILGSNWIFMIGSLTAYLISQLWDVSVFHKIRDKWIAREGNNKKRWIWNNVSTMTSQFIDTLIFITIAFGLGLGWLLSKETIPLFFGMIAGQYLIKFILAALDTPLFYFLTRNKENK